MIVDLGALLKLRSKVQRYLVDEIDLNVTEHFDVIYLMMYHTYGQIMEQVEDYILNPNKQINGFFFSNADNSIGIYVSETVFPRQLIKFHNAVPIDSKASPFHDIWQYHSDKLEQMGLKLSLKANGSYIHISPM